MGKKGTHLTPETIERMRLAHRTPEAIAIVRRTHLGKHHSPETIEKIRQSNIISHSTPEAKERSRRVHLGKCCPPEVKEKIRLAHLGKHPTTETRLKMSVAHTTPEAIERNRRVHLGTHPTPEALEKNRQANMGVRNAMYGKPGPHLGKYFSPETRKKMRAAHNTPEALERSHRAALGRRHTIEELDKMRKITQKRFEDPAFIKKWSDGLRSKTRLEKRVDALLQALYPNEFKYNGGYECGITIAGFTPDFVNVNGKKQLIEAFGSHWHPIGDDKIKQERYAEYGYSSLIIWDYELKNEKAVVQRIVEFVGKQPNHYFETCTGA